MWTVTFNTMGFKVTFQTQGNSESRTEAEISWEGWERVSQVFPKCPIFAQLEKGRSKFWLQIMIF